MATTLTLKNRVTKLEGRHGEGDAFKLIIFRKIINRVGDEGLAATFKDREWMREPEETEDEFTSRIEADLKNVPGVPMVILHQADLDL